MKIIYSNKSTEKLCEDFNKACKVLNKEVANKLSDLLNAIEAFPSLLDMLGLPQFRLHALKQDRKHQYSFVIHKGYKWRLIIYPLDEEGKVLVDNADERKMLAKAVMVEILEVSEHYD